jgi:hypothetical protein
MGVDCLPDHYHRRTDGSNVLVGSDLGPPAMPTILDAGTDPAGLDPFGQLKGGFIRLEGVLKVAQVRGSKEDIYNVALEVWDNEEKVGDLVYDVFSDLPKEDIFEVACLYFHQKSASRRNQQPTVTRAASE